MNQFLSVKDVTSVEALIGEALAYKTDPHKDPLLGKDRTLGMVFLNPSMRTRISTQIAARNLGMDVVVFQAEKEGWQLEYRRGTIMNGTAPEHVKEAAAVMGTYFDILSLRTFAGLKDRDEDYREVLLNQFRRYAGIPLVSLESATLHPLQSLADLVTIKESWNEKRPPRVVMSWAPHVKSLPQAVPNSFAEWMNRWGQAEFLITQPEGFELDPKFTGRATISYDQDKAFEGADYIYVKNWSSYRDYGKLSSDPGWQVTSEKLQKTAGAKVMHCLPVRRGVVIADEVLDGPASIVVRQAANRVCATQAVLAEILKKNLGKTNQQG
jgi:N-succinyl-L-ornithine transcarbamylase